MTNPAGWAAHSTAQRCSSVGGATATTNTPLATRRERRRRRRRAVVGAPTPASRSARGGDDAVVVGEPAQGGRGEIGHGSSSGGAARAGDVGAVDRTAAGARPRRPECLLRGVPAAGTRSAGNTRMGAQRRPGWGMIVGVAALSVRVDDDPAAARRPVDRPAPARRPSRRRGRATLAVSGGSTAPPMLAALAAMDLPWDAIDIWQVDERVAPDGDPDRNAGQLDGVPGHHHLMPVTAPDLRAAAAELRRRAPGALRRRAPRDGRRRAHRLVAARRSGHRQHRARSTSPASTRAASA